MMISNVNSFGKIGGWVGEGGVSNLKDDVVNVVLAFIVAILRKPDRW